MKRLSFLLLAVVAVGVHGFAYAQNYEKCSANTGMENFELCPDQGAAASAASSVADAIISSGASGYGPGRLTRGGMTMDANARSVYITINSPYGGGVGRVGRVWPAEGKTCGDRADYTGAGPTSTASGTTRNGSVSCMDGCEAAWFKNGDGTYTAKFSVTKKMCDGKPDCSAYEPNYYWNPFLQVCEPKLPETCPEGQEKGPDGTCQDLKCPSGMKLQEDGTCKPKDSECPAGQVKGPDGACVNKPDACGTGKAMGSDGTCKNDKDGDGKPDDEDSDDDGKDDRSSFSGGDSCSSPPACSGDAVMCGMARIQWRIDCNTRRNTNIAGGGCAAMPVCTGEKCDAIEYAQLIMQWRSACALEKLKISGGGQGEQGIKDYLTASKQAEANALRSLGTDDGHAGVDPSSIWAKQSDYGSSEISETMFGSGGGTCDLSFTIAGKLVTPPPQFWRICQIIHWLLVAAAYVWIAFKVGE